VTAITAYIGFGANVNPEANILDGLERLDRFAAVTRVSRFYRTAPVDRPDQPDFLNGVCEIRTAMPPRALKFLALRRIERACGRLRTLDRHAPRPLDLDILLYGSRIIREPSLVVPDPDLVSRAFLLVPLMELAGNIRLPGMGPNLATLCSAISYDPLIEEVAFMERLRERFPRWTVGWAIGNKPPQT